MPDQSDVYWCAKDNLDLASEAWARVKDFYTWLPSSTMYARWTRAYRVFYGLAGEEDPFDISKAGSTGQSGELTSIKINHAGSLTRRWVSLISNSIPEFAPIPENDDYTSIAQVDLGKKLLDYFMDTKGVGADLFRTALGAAIFGDSKYEIAWDPMAGPPLSVPDPLMPSKKNAGDLTFRVFTPLDLVIDRRRQDATHDWIITRRMVNRWDLVARYPAQKDDILSAKIEPFPAAPTNSLDAERATGNRNLNDQIPLFTLYHRKSDALPNGRWAFFLNADIFLGAGDLPYSKVPLVPICPGEIIRTPFGESLLHHVTALQEVYDNLASSVVTNNIQTGTQIILMPDNADYSYRELTEGAAVLGYDPGPEGKLKPEALVLTADNSAALNCMKLIVGEMETLYSIGATLRGKPEANVQSGAFGALVAQQALEYSGAFQYSFQQAVQASGDLIIEILRRFADQPIVAEIAGESGNYEVKEFQKKDFAGIRRVAVKSGNPASRTPAFNIAAADSLLAKGVIKDPKDYLTLVRTGNIDTMVKPAETASMNMRRENEQLRKGINPPVLFTDQHKEHIETCLQLLDDPGVRGNEKITTAALAHVQAHLMALRTTDPALLAMRGQTPLPPLPDGSVPTSPAAASPAGPADAGGVPGTQPGPDPVPPQTGGKLPMLPNLPDNPLTGKTWTPQDGAIQPH
jgi:hypothetical protein